MTQARWFFPAAARAAAVFSFILVSVLSSLPAHAGGDEKKEDPAARARVWESKARTHEDRGEDEWAASDWQTAARYWYLAGDQERTVSASDRAIQLARRDDRVGYLLTWRLYLDHGLINEKGDASLVDRWPGETFTEDLYSTLRRLEGNRDLGKWLVMYASQAVSGNRPAIALDLYMLAWGNAELMDEARKDVGTVEALLMALPMAIQLGRFDDAELIVARAASFASIPQETMDEYRTAVATARHNAARETKRKREIAEEEAASEAAAPGPNEGPRARGGLLELPPVEEADERSVPPAGESDSESARWSVLHVVLGLGVLVGLGLLFVRLRHRS